MRYNNISSATSPSKHIVFIIHLPAVLQAGIIIPVLQGRKLKFREVK
jgi:hypothetical protein